MFRQIGHVLTGTTWLIVLAAAAVPAVGQDPACPRRAAAEVEVRPRVAELITRRDRTIADLSGMPIDSVIAHKHEQRKVNGLTAGRIGFDVDVGFAGSGACRAVDRVQVVIALDQTVFIGSEFVPGSCADTAVMQHEMLHVTVDRQLVERIKPELASAVEQAIDKLDGLAAASPATFEGEARRQIAAAVERFGRSMRRDRVRLQNGVDRPSEYQRTRALCSDWP